MNHRKITNPAISLLTAMCVVALFAGEVRSDSVSPNVWGYADTEANYIVTGALKIQKDLKETIHFGAKGVVDAISSASTAAGTDATTGATGKVRVTMPDAYVGGFAKNSTKKDMFSETPNFDKSRVEISGYLSGDINETSITGGAIYSHEQLYQARTIYATLLQNLAQRNTVLTATYYHNFDTVDTDEEAVAQRYNYPKSKNVDGIALSVTQVLSRTTIAQFTGTYTLYSGALSDPKREVYYHPDSTNGQLSGGRVVPIPERLPDRRGRIGASARLNQYLWPGAAIQGGYRYYTDDWDIRSSTVEGELFQYAGAGKHVLLGVHGRYYTQSASKYLYFDVTPSENNFSASPLMEAFDSRLVGGRIQFLDQHAHFEKVAVSGGVKLDLYTQTAREGVPDGFEAVIGGANILTEF